MELATKYLGLDLPSPLVASASPLTGTVDNIRALEDCGTGAVVLPSIFQEQIEAETETAQSRFATGPDQFPPGLNHFPDPQDYRLSSGGYLELIRQARAAVNIPVIASLNGTSQAGWIEYARDLQQAGAHAIELNLYILPSDMTRSGQDVERECLAILAAVRHAVSIPIAVKLSPYFSSPGHMMHALARAGADGLVLFNRFYQPDIMLPARRLHRDLQLSTAGEIRLPLLWIAMMAAQCKASLAASTGVTTADEVVKYLLVGADVVMTTSALLRHGIGHMQVLRDGLRAWLNSEATSLGQMRGTMSHRKVSDPSAFERANYVHILQGGGTGAAPA